MWCDVVCVCVCVYVCGCVCVSVWVGVWVRVFLYERLIGWRAPKINLTSQVHKRHPFNLIVRWSSGVRLEHFKWRPWTKAKPLSCPFITLFSSPQTARHRSRAAKDALHNPNSNFNQFPETINHQLEVCLFQVSSIRILSLRTVHNASSLDGLTLC